jgi:nucleotide-binding universal stress UspA family protein
MSGETGVKKVLVAVDGSEPSQSALKYALYLASRFGAELVAVYVVEEEKVGYWRFIDEHFKKELLAKARQVLDEAQEAGRDYQVTVHSEILQGTQPYVEIVRYVEQNPEITTVVMGEHGMGFTDRHLLGSTTERVIRLIAKERIPVAVTVVPHVEPNSESCRIFAGPLCS